MADVLDKPEETTEGGEDPKPHLTPIDFAAIDFEPGVRAPWRCTPSDCYGPEELGDLKGVIETLLEGAKKADEAANLWEKLQAWEARLFRRNYQFLSAGRKGWGMEGGVGATTGAAIAQGQNAGKMFSANVYGGRHKKIVALLSRQVPPVESVPGDDADPIDQEAAQMALPYLKAFREQGKLRGKFAEAASYLYTDGRAAFLTYTVADSRFGKEAGDEGGPKPARRETVWVGGKLETKFPLMANDQEEMGWARCEWEVNKNELKARYPWVRDEISTGETSKDGGAQLAKLARANVRLAVQSSSSSSEGYQQETTEAVTFLRPSQFESVGDTDQRELLYETFPSGMEIWSAGGVMALVRESAMDDHLTICHATPGDGQNREAIGTNYLPIQKILNATVSLIDRYNRSAIARRFAGEPYIDTEAMNRQSNDPAKVTPVDVKSLIDAGLTMDQITAIEKVAEPNNSIMQWVQYLINGMPEAMDGGTPAIFGIEAEAAGRGTFGEARLNRDQALQVFSLPWGAMGMASAQIQKQALDSAGQNRISPFTLSLPSERLNVDPSKLKGNVLVWSTSTEIPPTLSEQQAEIENMLQNMGSVPIYAAILSDPRNLEIVKRFPTLAGMKIPGVQDVENQMKENQELLAGEPMPNPAIMPLQEQIMALEQQVAPILAAVHANPATEQMAAPRIQQAQTQMQALQQQIQALPPLVSSVPPAQDDSQDHAIHAAIAKAELNSPHGQAAPEAGQANLHLHYTEHMALAKKLAVPPPIPVKATINMDAGELPPAAEAAVLSRMTIPIPAPALEQPGATHEIKQETEGVDPTTGVPTKRTVSVTGQPLN